MRLAADLGDPVAHPRHEGVDRVHDAEEVDVEDPAPAIEALRSDRRVADHARVVAEHVDAAVALVAAVGERLDGRDIAHVDGLGERLAASGGNLRRHRLGGVGLDVGDHDAHTLAGEREHDPAADAAAAPADQRHATLELPHHAPPRAEPAQALYEA